MALTAKQRNKLPPEAFVYKPDPNKRSTWRYPVPTKAQARAAGISETQRQNIHSAALSYAASPKTMGTIGTVKAVVNKRRNR
jgi:hypothetical protein